MGRECDVVQGGKRVMESQRFGVEHVEVIPPDTSRRLAGTIRSRVPVFAANAVRDRVSPQRGLANEGASMTNDPELHPLMSLRLCAALWLGSIARHELIEKLCRAFLPRFPSLRSPDFARAS
jgi:hypothetical protein